MRLTAVLTSIAAISLFSLSLSANAAESTQANASSVQSTGVQVNVTRAKHVDVKHVKMISTNEKIMGPQIYMLATHSVTAKSNALPSPIESRPAIYGPLVYQPGVRGRFLDRFSLSRIISNLELKPGEHVTYLFDLMDKDYLTANDHLGSFMLTVTREHDGEYQYFWCNQNKEVCTSGLVSPNFVLKSSNGEYHVQLHIKNDVHKAKQGIEATE